MPAPAPATAARPRARYAARREAIMAAATQVLAEQGVSGFTLAAVAKRMDLHPVSLTYYFKRKEDLASARLLHTLSRYGAMLDQAACEPTPAARLRRLVELFVQARQQIAMGLEPPLASFNEIHLVGGPEHEALLRAYGDFHRRLGALLASEAHPWIRGDRQRLLARLIVEQLFWVSAWLTAYQPEDYPRVAERLADIMIGGLAATGEPWPEDAPLLLGVPEGQNDEVTRERFLVAATELINREGYRGASVDKISAELNVTKGSFYHHNTDKDELAAACFERTFQIVNEARREAAGAPNGWRRLWLAAASLALHQASGERGPMLRHYALAALPLEMRRTMLHRFDQIAHAFAGMISDGIADGSIRPVDPLLAARLVMAMFNSAHIVGVDRRALARGILNSYVRPALLGVFSAPPPRQVEG